MDKEHSAYSLWVQSRLVCLALSISGQTLIEVFFLNCIPQPPPCNRQPRLFKVNTAENKMQHWRRRRGRAFWPNTTSDRLSGQAGGHPCTPSGVINRCYMCNANNYRLGEVGRYKLNLWDTVHPNLHRQPHFCSHTGRIVTLLNSAVWLISTKFGGGEEELVKV